MLFFNVHKSKGSCSQSQQDENSSKHSSIIKCDNYLPPACISWGIVRGIIYVISNTNTNFKNCLDASLVYSPTKMILHHEASPRSLLYSAPQQIIWSIPYTCRIFSSPPTLPFHHLNFFQEGPHLVWFIFVPDKSGLPPLISWEGLRWGRRQRSSGEMLIHVAGSFQRGHRPGKRQGIYLYIYILMIFCFIFKRWIVIIYTDKHWITLEAIQSC